MNDCVQFIIYTLGAIVTLYLIVGALPGGAGELWEFASSTGRLRVFDWSVSLVSPSMTFLSGLIGGAFLTMATHGADHLMVQRYLCARSQASAGWALGLSGPLVGLQFLLFLVIGIALAAFYAGTAVGYEVEGGDRAFMSFVVHELPIGVRGAVIAAVLAASMSTLSSSLNASAGVLVADVMSFFGRGSSDPSTEDASQLVVSRAKWATLLFAFLQGAVAIVGHARSIDSSVIDAVLAIAAISTGLVLGLYGLGLAVGKASVAAGAVGFLVGFGVCSAVAFGTDVSWAWYSLIGSATTFGVGYAISRGVPPEPEPTGVAG